VGLWVSRPPSQAVPGFNIVNVQYWNEPVTFAISLLNPSLETNYLGTDLRQIRDM